MPLSGCRGIGSIRIQTKETVWRFSKGATSRKTWNGSARGKAGNVCENREAVGDVTSKIQKYWKDYRNGELTEVQLSGEPQKQG